MPTLDQSTRARLHRGHVPPESRARLRACELAANSGARLRLAAARKGGEAGLALACATIDMVLARETDPASWPLEELILLLEGGSPCGDRQVDRLLEALRQLQADIDEIDRDADEDELAPAQRRAA